MATPEKTVGFVENGIAYISLAQVAKNLLDRI
jgi:hypothetical protein